MKAIEDSNKFILTKIEAEFRKNELISEENKYYINYDLIITLRKSGDKHFNQNYFTKDFEGRIKITFDYFPKTTEHINLDYHGHIHKIQINGKNKKIIHNKRKLVLKKNNLLINQRNVVVIYFSSSYGSGGLGLHNFIDSADNKQYLYTLFVPFECNTVFPVFDQPDLKATLDLTLCGFHEWVLLSNESEKYSKKIVSNLSFSDENLFENSEQIDFDYLFGSILDKNYKIVKFFQTPKLSSYLYAFCAGSYICFEDENKYKIPLRVFMRESMKKCGDPKECMRITKSGIEWYENFFGHPYPFRKYDQIFVPELNYGAMENVGLVTFKETYCWKNIPTQKQKTGFCLVILHELAHMWFGNYVTMKWWDDLWLNESFAEYISSLCQERALGEFYKNSWCYFNSGKENAYKEDQNITTHPVYSDILDTEMAHSNFDAIVYDKGSALLKQMFYIIGDKNFSTGLNSYFTKFRWDNTVFDNFIDEMVNSISLSKDGEGQKFDIKNISKKWLKEAGLNEIQLRLQEDKDGNIKIFNILQISCLEIYKNLQTHLIEILFVYENEENKIFKNILINNTENTEIYQFIGLKAPQAVVINYNDYGYFKWIIDNKSLNYFKLKDNLYKNCDILTRKIIYRSVFDSVRHPGILSFDYIDIVIHFLKFESEDQLISCNLVYLLGIISFFLPKKYYCKYSALIFELISKLIKKFLNQTNLIFVLIEYLIIFANNSEHIKIFLDWIKDEPYVVVDGEKVFFPCELLNQISRHSILIKLHEVDNICLEEKNKILENEIIRDNFSDKSLKTKLTCRSSLPDIEIKNEIWEKIIKNSTSDSLHNMKAYMIGFAPVTQLKLVEPFLKKRFFDDLMELGKNNYFYIDYFFMHCSPINYVEENVLKKTEQLINSFDNSNEYLKKKLIELHDHMKNISIAQALSESKMNELLI